MKKKLTTALLFLSLLLSGCGTTPSSGGSPSTPPNPSTPMISTCEHSYSGELKYDDDHHYKECEKCREKFEVSPHEFKEEITVKPGCETTGTKVISCLKSDYEKHETLDVLGHDFKDEKIEKPTVDLEGTYESSCSRCPEKITKKILKLPANITLNNDEISWSEVTNAEGYVLTLGEKRIDVGNLTSYRLESLQDLTDVLQVVAYTSDESYYNYEECSTSEVITRGKDNLQSSYNSNFSNGSRIRLDRIGGWNNYPYGNWSDMNNGLGGHYYIEEENDGNMMARIPAVVWYPGNTTMKRDLGSGCYDVGTYEISFDIKASEKSLSYNANGKYGHISGYLWNNHNASDSLYVGTSSTLFNTTGLVVKDIPGISTTSYTNVRLRFTLNEKVTYNQFNLIYWPEHELGEDNCVFVDNIEVFQVVANVVQEENVDENIGGDFEAWSTREMNNNHWYANNTVLPEKSTLGSSIVHEDGNDALKIQAKSSIAQFNLKGNKEELPKGGIYEMDIKVKKADASINPTLAFTMWGFAGGNTTELMTQTEIDIASAKEDQFTKYTVRFATKEATNIDSINIFFTINFHSENVETNYLIIDDVEIYRLGLGEDSTMNILMIGNSFMDDTIEYVYRILDNLNYDTSKLNLYGLFRGGCSIEQHYEFFEKHLASYDLRSWDHENKKWFNLLSLCDMKTALSLRSSWDIITFQQASFAWDDMKKFEKLPILASEIRKIVGEQTSFVFNGAWSYREDAPEIVSGAFASQMGMYQDIIRGEQILMSDDYEVKFDKLIPSTTSVQNARQIYGQGGLNRDDRHLSFGLGRFVASMTMVATVFEQDISKVSYFPSGMSIADLENVKKAVLAAVEKPYELTAM